MAEWLFEAGIGEDRAALVENGTILEARIDRHDGRIREGAIFPARLIRRADTTGRGEVELDGGTMAWLDPVPRELTEGASLLVEVVRESLPDWGGAKPPKVRAALEPRPAPDLLDRLRATGMPVRIIRAHEPDALEEAGWSELMEEAATGIAAFPGGLLRTALTPAMTLIDVDGTLGAAELAKAGAAAAGRAVRRLDIGGSIGIDLPTTPDKAARQAAAAALDAALPQSFERTAVNGFGFLQIVRRRTRASLPELIQSDPATAAALALLRRAERTLVGGAATLVSAPAVIRMLEAEPDWTAELARRTGAAIGLRAEPALPMSAGYAEPETRR